jgi:hypothetical protein
VPGLIAEIGGTASDERFWILHVVSAELSWQEIQVVTTHPDVESMGSAEGGSLAVEPDVLTP